MADKTNIASNTPNTHKTHVVAVVVYDGVIPTDASIPCDAFARVTLNDGRHPYRIKVCAVSPTINAGFFHLNAPFTLAPLKTADTIILPGLADTEQVFPAPLINALRRAASRGARIASICTGAFVLAASGLLNGSRATTHWRATNKLARDYPDIEVDPNVLYVDNGNILSSAGAFAGVDLCLHMIRKDFGAEVAANIARLSLMPLERAGGQMQFVRNPLPKAGYGELQALLAWIEGNLNQDLSIKHLAARAAMSPRTLNRRFIDRLGTTPSNWILQHRTRCAQLLLETSDYSIERVAIEAGFGSTANFRDQFRKIVGTSPSEYRRSFGVAHISRNAVQ